MADPRTGEPAGARLGRLAEAFAGTMGWAGPPAPAVSAQGEEPSHPDLDAHLSTLERALADDRRTDLAWWRSLADAWYACGSPGLALRCARHARELRTDGAVAWEDIAALVRLEARICAEGEPPPRQALPWPIGPRDADAGLRRLNAILGDAPLEPWQNRTLPLSRIAWGLPRAEGEFTTWLAHAFHYLGEPRIVVEQVLLDIAARGIAVRSTHRRELLVLAGLSLQRVGDRPGSYACFRLAVGTDRVPERSERELSRDEEVLAEGARELGFLKDITLDPRSADGEFAVFDGGLRLVAWLLENDSAGFVPDFLGNLGGGPLGMHHNALRRQVAWAARESGWFRAPRMPVPPNPRGPVLGGRPRRVAIGTVDRIGGRPLRPARPPARGGTPRPSSTAPRVDIPIGMTDGGGQAVLRVGEGSRVLLLGPPFEGRVLARVGAHLAAAGWTVLLVRPERSVEAGVNDRWHRLDTTGRRGADRPWAGEIARSAAMRATVRSVLADGLPPCPDPAAAACLEPVVEALEDSTRSVWRDSAEKVREFACAAVDSAAGLRYDRALDLRRAVFLVDRVELAVRAVARALSLAWATPPRPLLGAGMAACLEVPVGDRLTATLQLALCVETLLADADRPADPPSPSSADEDFMSTPLAFKRREEALDREIIEAAKAAEERTPSPEPSSPAGSASGGDRPRPSRLWRRGDARRFGSPPGVCVLIDAAVEADLPAALVGPGRHALVASAVEPTAAALGAVRGFDELLVGALPRERVGLVEIAAGARLHSLSADPPGLGGAAHFRMSEGREQGPRFVVWPTEPAGWGAA
ncbi:hypothetical protein ACFVUH_30190 [Kitasatospora sp. NPDC058032]|uniref:hypothetical protein n=1 Tax=Kitasatospora sp. NPDC058032 TaxID=3346307 RepID=UPI0036D8EA66